MKNISLVLAGAILLLHGIIPHRHHSELGEAEHIQQHQQADDLFDLLQLVFHTDPGQDHLEDLKTSSFYLNSPVLNNDIAVPYHYVFRTVKISKENLFYSSNQEILHLRFRGPPMA